MAHTSAPQAKGGNDLMHMKVLLVLAISMTAGRDLAVVFVHAFAGTRPLGCGNWNTCAEEEGGGS